MLELNKIKIITNCGAEASAYSINKNDEKIGFVEIEGYIEPNVCLKKEMPLNELNEICDLIQNKKEKLLQQT